MIAAHMDEVGLMVKSIDSQGFLRVVPVGGVDAAILPGLRVDVHTSQGILRGVVGRKPIHLIESDERTKGDSHQRAFHRPGASAASRCVKRFALGTSLRMALVSRNTVRGWPFHELSMTKRACT